MSIFEELKNRGVIYQSTNEEKLQKALDNEALTVFLGVDPTADSLHVGHLATYMILAHLQKAGHSVITLVGGGTAMVGDPSGKQEDRPLLQREHIEENVAHLQDQISRLITLDGTKGRMVDNYDWLSGLELIPFLRDIGTSFRVNEMIKAEGYKERLERETGLSFLEFSYQLMQAYDYLKLYGDFGCSLQIGGSDQWGNIVAGVSLIRKKKGKDVHAFTVPLLTTSDGKKMGKSVGGAVWLDGEKVSPYEFYQYWINVTDEDVIRFLKIFTFLPLEEIDQLAKLQGADIRKAKERLAYEVTSFVHGEDAAKKAQETSSGVFGGNGETEELPVVQVSVGDGIDILELLISIVDSKSEARRLVEQGGISINEEVIQLGRIIKREDFSDGELLLRIGKKKYYRVLG